MGLRSVSFQLPCEEDVLPLPLRTSCSACPGSCELLQLSVEEVCADFDAMLRPWHLRRGGARVLRVAQRADARAELAGRPGQSRSSGEGAPRRALLHVQSREEGAGAAGDVQPGLFWCEDLREGQLMAAISSPAQCCGLRLRRGTRIRELPEEHVVRGAQPEGPAPGRLGARDFFEAAEGEAGSARRGGGRRPWPRRTASARAFASWRGQRANFAGAVRRLPQLRESAQPTSLKSLFRTGLRCKMLFFSSVCLDEKNHSFCTILHGFCMT